MSSLKELARLMAELEDQLVSCMRCGLCQAVCPLFAETGREADVARSKLAANPGGPSARRHIAMKSTPGLSSTFIISLPATHCTGEDLTDETI